MGFQRGRKEYSFFSSIKKTEKKLSFPTLGTLQCKSPSGLISTARAPSSDSLTPPLWDVDLNIHRSNGRTHAVGRPAEFSTTELVCSMSCQHQTVIYRDIKSRDAKPGTAYRQFNSMGFFRHAPNICTTDLNQR